MLLAVNVLGAVDVDTLATAIGEVITLLIAVILETLEGLIKPSIAPVADVNSNGKPPGVSDTENVVELNMSTI